MPRQSRDRVSLRSLLLGLACLFVLLLVLTTAVVVAQRPVRCFGSEFVVHIDHPDSLPAVMIQGLAGSTYDRADADGYEVGTGWVLTLHRWRFHLIRFMHQRRRGW